MGVLDLIPVLYSPCVQRCKDFQRVTKDPLRATGYCQVLLCSLFLGETKQVTTKARVFSSSSMQGS